MLDRYLFVRLQDIRQKDHFPLVLAPYFIFCTWETPSKEVGIFFCLRSSQIRPK